MDEISLGVPAGVLESLPDQDGTAAQDLQRAVAGIERTLNDAIAEADDESEAVAVVADAVGTMEDKAEEYNEFVPELRAWGQSPIYAIAWRNCYLELLAQLNEVQWIADGLDRERTYRQFEDGIRFGKD